MLKQQLKIMLSVILIWTLSLEKSSALELSPKTGDFACLSRAQKEKIADCFSEQIFYDESLKIATASNDDFWTAVELSLAGGILAGFILGMKIHK